MFWCRRQYCTYSYTDSCGQTWGGPALVPSVPNSQSVIPTTPVYYGTFTTLGSLLGCPLNGIWKITVCDHFFIDNGYMFNWSMSFNDAIVPGEDGNYNVNLDTVIWHGSNITPTSFNSAIINLGAAGLIIMLLWLMNMVANGIRLLL